MAMSQDFKKSGFSLFPAPPTPPARVSRHRLRRKAISHAVSSGGSLPPLHELLPYPDGDLSADEAVLRDLRSLSPLPAAMQIPQRKHAWDQNDSVSTRTSQAYEQHDCSKTQTFNVRDRTAKPQVQLAWSANCLNRRAEPVIVPLRTPIEPSQARKSRRPSTDRLSQLIDAQQGEIDHKKLSMYLGNVLNPSFEMPDLSAKPKPLPEPASPCCLTTENQTDRGLQPMQNGLGISRSRSAEGCRCKFGAVICQCSSSSEFHLFKKARPDHRPQASVSSTRCLVGVPRARFKTVFLDIEIPESLYIPDMWSPPALSYSSDGSKGRESLDWSTPASPIPEEGPLDPPGDSVISNEDHEANQHVKPVIKTPTKPFFLRPFFKLNTAGARASAEPETKVTVQEPDARRYLGSMDTLSTFHFDLDKRGNGTNDNSRPSSTLPDENRSVEATASRKASLQPQKMDKLTSMSSNQARLGRASHISHASSQSWGDASVCSSSFEVFEPANMAIMAQATPAKAVMVINKQNSVMSRRASNLPFKERAHSQTQAQQESRDGTYQPPWVQVGRKLTVRNPDRTSTATSVASSVPRHEARISPPINSRGDKGTATRVEIGAEYKAMDHCRRATSDGSPVLGKARLVLVSQ